MKCVCGALLLIAAVFVALLDSPALGYTNLPNNRPIIGIMTQPTSGDMAKFGDAYIAASYVKYLESAGARVVPIPYNSTKEDLIYYFNSLNGILFPGGGADLVPSNPFYTAEEFLFNLAVQANKAGDYFPIWATCLGFESVNVIVSQDYSLLDCNLDSENLSLPLTWAPGYQNSRLFKNAPASVINTLTNEAATLNNHVCGVTPAAFNANKNLVSFFQVLSTNVDRNGVEFVSTIEAYDYPIYATQWHPEKNAFEWATDEAIDHSFEAIQMSQYVANFFVNEARKSTHKFPTPQAAALALIYNYTPVYTGLAIGSDFAQCYFF
eukprot:GEZU01036161.1.p2 GENE.GEZU01036161.1~~GEZU01036161.1.p2  ORF type:complete len:323 (+),score=115.49 GEZU01036161.1:34-1002(+)